MIHMPLFGCSLAFTRIQFMVILALVQRINDSITVASSIFSLLMSCLTIMQMYLGGRE